jgi:hypothetical protein
MIAFYLILAACPVLMLGVVTFIALIAIGVRKGDHGDLASPPASRLDALTRRMTGVGARNSNKGES